MKKILSIACLFACAVLHAQSLTRYVNPHIGSGGHGHVFVGASVPFGAVQLGPSNIYKGWDWCSGYNYDDSIIAGFAHLHLSGTGIGDLGDVLIMPYTGEVKLSKGTQENHSSGYSSLYKHANEKVRPGYYSVKLDDSNIQVELTATARVGYHRYHFPENGKAAHIIIDLKEGINDKTTDSYLEQKDAYTLVGYRASSGWAKKQQEYFAIRFAKPIAQLSLYEENKLLNTTKANGIAIKGLIGFKSAPGIVAFKVGLSPVSTDNALKNIDAELPGWDFEKVVADADKLWNKELSKIRIETKDAATREVFYTALYHTMINPSLFNDHNKDYRGVNGVHYKSASFDNYSVFSLWDTYRAVHPLFALTQPQRVNDMINSMLAVYEQKGKLPIWQLMGYETGTMVGISSEQVIAEAYLKGFKGFDANRAWNALKSTATSDTLGLNYVAAGKPIPSDTNIFRPVARALEYNIGDASIALMAKAMGKEADYNYFKKRSGSYHLYYDAQTGFFRGKLSNGNWTQPFDPVKSNKPWAADYAEGNAWQYLWLAPHDVDGLVALLGGKEKFINRLDSFFALQSPPDPQALADLTGMIGQYAHGNEPSHHIAYLYAMVGEQWKTAEKVRQIMREFYHNKPDGIIGNEDCGQMSAWYIFSALGFYPVFPASGEYVIGSPVVDKASITTPSGKVFTVEAVNNSAENIYVQKIELNGKAYTKHTIQHSELLKGGTLKFFMGKGKK